MGVVLEVVPFGAKIGAIISVTEMIEAEKRGLAARETVLIGDRDEQEDSIPMPLSPAR